MFSRIIFLFGSGSQNLIEVISSILQLRFDRKEVLKNSVSLTYNVIFPVFVITIALGLVIGIQLAPEFVSKGIGGQMGILSALIMTRELAPVIGSMMIATQYGTGLAAELANMKITQQIDALKVFNVNPVVHLVTPRFLAAVLCVPMIIWLSALLGIASTFIVSWLKEDLYFGSFANSIWLYFQIEDLWLCFFKSAIFAAIIVMVSSTLGLNTRGGAKEVGRTTMLSVIVSFVLIVIVDYIISSIYL